MRFKISVLAFFASVFFLCSASSAIAQQQLPEIIWSQLINNADPASSGSAYSIKFSPDGQRIFAGGTNSYDTDAGSITTFNAADGAVLGTTSYYRPVTPINELAISPDGQRLATVHNGVLCYNNQQTDCRLSYILYDPFNLSRVSEPPTTFYPSQSVDYSPNGQIVAVGDYTPVNNIKFLNPTDLSIVRTLPGHSLGGNNGRTMSVRFSPDGQLLASGGGDGNVKIWRVSDGSLLRTLNINSLKVEVFSVNFSPDGQYIAATDRDNTSKVKIWRVSDGTLVKTFINPEFANISSHKVVWTPDGRYVVTSFVTVSSGSRIVFRDFNTGETVREYSVPYINAYTPSSIKDIEFSNDGLTFAYGLGPRVFLARNPLAAKNATFADFDGDGRSDPAVYRGGVWHMQESANGYVNVQFGLPTDKIMPADFDGDGKTDIAVFRDGVWYWLNSSNNSFNAVQFGQAGDVPVPADYSGDGRAEIAVYRGGFWYTRNLVNNQFQGVQFGNTTDKPVPADFDGDGKTDFAVYRNGTWYLLRSSQGFTAVQFGNATDKPTIGDFDGDGKTDQAVYRSGVWYVLGSKQGFYGVQFGAVSDVPVAADYDGDGKTDFAVFRDGVWYMFGSRTGNNAVQFGISNDKPIQAAFIQ